MSEKLSNWLTDDQTFTAKFMFDHLRNIGLCALVLVSAAFLIKNDGSIVSLVILPPHVAGWFLLVIGVFLVIINSTQFSLVAAFSTAESYSSKLGIGIAVFAITGWSQFLAYYVLLAQISRLLS